jgi:hypothetical protein
VTENTDTRLGGPDPDGFADVSDALHGSNDCCQGSRTIGSGASFFVLMLNDTAAALCRAWQKNCEVRAPKTAEADCSSIYGVRESPAGTEVAETSRAMRNSGMDWTAMMVGIGMGMPRAVRAGATFGCWRSDKRKTQPQSGKPRKPQRPGSSGWLTPMTAYAYHWEPT